MVAGNNAVWQRIMDVLNKTSGEEGQQKVWWLSGKFGALRRMIASSNPTLAAM